MANGDLLGASVLVGLVNGFVGDARRWGNSASASWILEENEDSRDGLEGEDELCAGLLDSDGRFMTVLV